MLSAPDLVPRPAMHSIFLDSAGHVRPLFRALLFVALAYVFLSPVQTTVGALTRGLPQRWFLPLVYVALNAVLLCLTWLFLRALDQRGFRALGLWVGPGWGRELAAGAGIGAALAALVVGGIVVLHGIRYSGLAAANASIALGILRVGGLLFLAAAYEEILFRGYAFQRLVDALGSWGAVLVVSALFGVSHLRNPAVTPLSTANTVLGGMLFSVAYLKTRALWLPIGLHWAWNFLLGPVLSLCVSGFQFGRPLFQTAIVGPVWLSGGAYGPEGSAVMTVVGVAAVVWLACTRRISPSPAAKEALE